MEAKIISYDNVNGKGILITKENEKIDFSIDKWNSFDTLPEIGLLVEIDENWNLVSKEILKHGDKNAEKIAELELKRANIDTSHIIHFILTILTAGLWLIVWAISGFVSVSQRNTLDSQIAQLKLRNIRNNNANTTIKKDNDVTPPAMLKVVSNKDNKKESIIIRIVFIIGIILIIITFLIDIKSYL